MLSLVFPHLLERYKDRQAPPAAHGRLGSFGPALDVSF
jgi:hypothetical protein